MKIDASSETRLKGVHPDLVRVFRRFAKDSKLPFSAVITCGSRTLAEQRKNVARGVSWTLKSRHIPESNRSKMAEAIDLAPTVGGKLKWDWPYFHQIAAEFKAAATAEKVPIVWGGDWSKNKDGPHFELRRKEYPA